MILSCAAAGHRGSSEQIFDGLIWAVRNGANIISMSIGIDFTRLVEALMEGQGLELAPATSQALSAYGETLRLFDRLAGLVAHSSTFGNAIVVAAAGNESKRPRYEIATVPPAASDGFILVGALQLKAGVHGPYEWPTSPTLCLTSPRPV